MVTARTAAWFIPRCIESSKTRADQVAKGLVTYETTMLPAAMPKSEIIVS